MPTFKTEVLHLVNNVQLVKWLLLCNEQHIIITLPSTLAVIYMMHFITKAMPISYIDSYIDSN